MVNKISKMLPTGLQRLKERSKFKVVLESTIKHSKTRFMQTLKLQTLNLRCGTLELNPLQILERIVKIMGKLIHKILLTNSNSTIMWVKALQHAKIAYSLQLLLLVLIPVARILISKLEMARLLMRNKPRKLQGTCWSWSLPVLVVTASVALDVFAPV